MLTTHVYNCVSHDVQEAAQKYRRDHDNILSWEEADPNVSAAESEFEKGINVEDWSSEVFFDHLSMEH
jgi:hypothetical protein